MLNVVNPYTFDSAILPYRVDVLPWSSVDGSSGMTYTRYQSSFYLSGGLGGSDASPSNGSTMQWNVLLAAGTWRLDVVWTGAPSYGIVDFDLDGTTVGSVDLYTGSTNAVASITGIAVAAGLHVLRSTVNGKNVSSSGYRSAFSSLTLTRTGA